MNQQAIEAAITALTSTVMDDQKTSWASNMPAWAGLDGLTHHMDFEELCGSIDLGHVAAEVIEAARPHLEAELRAKIAAEIMQAQAQKMRENPFGPFNTDPIATGYIAGLREAARIVRSEA